MGIANFTKIITDNADLEKLQSLLATIFQRLNRLPFMDGTSGKVAKSTGANGFEWGQVEAAGIADGAVTTAKLADNSVTSAKIVNGAIVNADVNASAAIEGSKIVAASATVAGVVSTTTQTFAGVKTFASGSGVSAATPVFVTDSTNGDLNSDELVATPVRVTSADGSSGGTTLEIRSVSQHASGQSARIEFHTAVGGALTEVMRVSAVGTVTTGNLVLTGADTDTSAPGAVSTYLRLTINGTTYKMALLGNTA